MRIGVLGTGMVGRALAGRLAGLDHDVVVGTRDVEQTLARTDPDAMGNAPYSKWPGRHGVFLAGEDAAAKETVKGLLGEFGWPEEAIVDLGGIRAARGTEMYLPLWLSLMGVLGTATSTSRSSRRRSLL
jgi:predicted dinucleotide-binding enzyme